MMSNMKKVHPKSYLVGAVLCLLCLLGIIYYCFFASFSTYEDTQYIYIDQDDTADSVCAKLRPYGNAATLSAFSTLARMTSYDDHIRTGKYAIPPKENVLTLFRHIKNGRQEPIRLTIPESRTMDRLAGSLSRKLMLDSTVVAILLRDSSFCAQQGYDTATIACLFVPNTYEVYWDITIENFMKRMKKEHDLFWEGERATKAQSLGLTPNEVCTVASIIDEETANNAEKPMIAGMYLNRLKTGMPLQADPTVKFAMQDFALKRIYHDMLVFDSPYNTYKNIGLPPGPIKVASIAGIDAVLNRVDHPYLYMCAKEDFSGTHNFATTYQEHLKNAARYAKALNERGIK
jgi:UPF0755 protein